VQNRDIRHGRASWLPWGVTGRGFCMRRPRSLRGVAVPFPGRWASPGTVRRGGDGVRSGEGESAGAGFCLAAGFTGRG
jgi:hypothetical protein